MVNKRLSCWSLYIHSVSLEVNELLHLLQHWVQTHTISMYPTKVAALTCEQLSSTPYAPFCRCNQRQHDNGPG